MKFKSVENMMAEFRQKPSLYFEKLAEFRTILTTHIFLATLRLIGPRSKYLQTSGLNLSIAWQMVINAMSEIEKIDFESVNEKVLSFVEEAND